MDFQSRYQKLNDAQRLAVETIEGPVMVVAGPGTGKTELLSMRAGNILRQTDVLPENILCLTYTDAGASNMRNRLFQIIGKDSYKIAVHTFHSFASEIINRNRQYFYNGAELQLADDLTCYQMVNEILQELPHNNPLITTYDGEYVHISDILKVIAEFKKSGLSSQELVEIIDADTAVVNQVNIWLTPIFDGGIKKTTHEELAKHVTNIKQLDGTVKTTGIFPLSTAIAESLEQAIIDAVSTHPTKPITAWRNKWFTGGAGKQYVLKSTNRLNKLRSACQVYDKYLQKMHSEGLFDYDDMILQLVHQLEENDDLRFNLQEQYQYIMVDEFQDTNLAQMRIIHSLTTDMAHGGEPNVLVVGDDDQAIFSFQGAEISNIIDFRNTYPTAQTVILTDNYRSVDDILKNARHIITQGKNRLENVFTDIVKILNPKTDVNSGEIILAEASSIADERDFIVSEIKKRLNRGEKAQNIAVIGRKHKELTSLLPYFAKAGIAVSYERRDNVLEIAPIVALEQLARLLVDMFYGNHSSIDEKLPIVLAHPAWNINAKDLWQLSLKAYNERLSWLDAMQTSEVFAPIHNWLMETYKMIGDMPLEIMVDRLIGNPKSTDGNVEPDFISPYYNYFYSQDVLTNQTDEYITFLDALRTIRSELRNHQPNRQHTLITFVDYITASRKVGHTISIMRRIGELDNSINLVTAHGAKGLEFETVYIFDAVETVWGAKANGRQRLIGYPENLPIAPAGDTDDERLRLFYVAVTRAKSSLTISYALENDNGKSTNVVAALAESDLNITKIEPPTTSQDLLVSAEVAWYDSLIKPENHGLKQLLDSTLSDYKLSVTALQCFLDVTRGGPKNFLVQNLLHFPSAKSPSASFGTAVHAALQDAHLYFIQNRALKPIDKILEKFEYELRKEHLLNHDFIRLLSKGQEALQNYFIRKGDTFNVSQKPELSFGGQNVIVGGAHLSGKLDLIEITPDKTVLVTDYKTGKAVEGNGKTPLDKLKLYHYQQQLYFYKLLIENSRDYSQYLVKSGEIQFIEPLISGEVYTHSIRFELEEVKRLEKLIEAVWRHIIKLDLPDTDHYDQSLKGVIQFEQDLIDEKI